MEQTLGILMADLSGYTALTETHGAVMAADMIDRYTGIVRNCLAGDSTLHERAGDAVMIVSASANCLLATAVMILQKTTREHNFLQLHGGLHYGTVLKRGNSYFGTALNLTARIASVAEPGTFLCSSQFAQALSDPLNHPLKSRGSFSFKNLSQESELFEVSYEGYGDFYIDPVCRMLILDCERAIRHPVANNIFFCSPDCLGKYLQTEV